MKRIICLLLMMSCLSLRLAADGTGLHTVVIDAGHGGKDAGCVSTDGKTYEKTLVLEIANSLASKIRAEYPDVKVVMTRSTDVFVPLNDRADIANKAEGDLFISIHINSFGKSTPNGYSVHVLGQSKTERNKNKDYFAYNMDVCLRENSVITLEEDYTTKYQGYDPADPESFIFMSLMQNSHLEQSLRFAQIVSENLKGGPIKADRGLSQDNFLVLWRTAMPSVLVELGFISNPTDLTALRKKANRDDLAGRLFLAFKEYKAIYDSSVSLDGLNGADSKPAEESAAGENRPAGESTGTESSPWQEQGNGSIQTEPLYAVQILVSGKSFAEGDERFLGYKPLSLKAGKYTKYFISVSENPDIPRKNLKSIKKEYPDAFIVKIEGGNAVRIK